MDKVSSEGLEGNGEKIIPNELIDKMLQNTKKLKELEKQISNAYKDLVQLFCELSSIFLDNYFSEVKVGDILIVVSCGESGGCIGYEVKVIEKTEKYIRCQESRNAYVTQLKESEEKCKEYAVEASCIITQQMYEELKKYLSITHLERKF